MTRKVQVDHRIFDAIRNADAPEVERDAVEQLLAEHFSGKRNAIRTSRMLDITVSGQHGPFRAVAVDISRSGMLMQVTDPQFASADELQDLMPHTSFVKHHFGEGFKVRFSDSGVKAAGTVVRVTRYCGGGNNLILTGCRFARMLGERDCEKLGIEYADDRAPGSGKE